MELKELKVQAYDCLAMVDYYQNKLRELNAEISRVAREPKPETKPETKEEQKVVISDLAITPAATGNIQISAHQGGDVTYTSKEPKK